MILILQIALGIVLAVVILGALAAWVDRPAPVDGWASYRRRMREREKLLVKEARLQYERDHLIEAKVRRNIWWVLPAVVVAEVILVAFAVWLFGGM